MPISPIVLQRRHAELGRIRLGNKGDRGQPQKLSSFRFTSPSEGYIKDLAELYGGTPQPWDNGGKAEWEVYTTATSIPVIAVKGGLSQWLEFWQGGGCVHRCDGETNVLTGEACDLDEQVKTRVRGQDVWVNPHAEAKPTTRLSVMLPELDAIGVWRMESHGWNAAAEIPAVAELAQYVGDLVPAVLHLVERRTVKDGKTSRFVVPVLDLRIGQARLREIVQSVSGGEPLELAAPAGAQTAAIEAPRPVEQAPRAERPDYESLIPESDLQGVRELWQEASSKGHLDDALRGKLLARAEQLKAQEQPDADGVVDAELVPDEAPASTAQPPGQPDPDAVWQRVLVVASERRGWGLDEVAADFKSVMNIIPDEASGPELAAYLHVIETGEEPAA
jgi:hypothetical protein